VSPVTHPGKVDQRTVIFSDPTLTMVAICVLVAKLGGKATITQADIDTVAYTRLLEHVQTDGSIELEMQQPRSMQG
jgi:hypothetical protein